jgi:hypothetical protein
MAQIGGYLQPDEHAKFKAYANEFGLSESALANLLLVREIRVRRLRDLKGKYSASTPSESRERVTAHSSDPALKTAFALVCSEEGLKPDQAASILFRAELSDGWLGQAIAG